MTLDSYEISPQPASLCKTEDIVDQQLKAYVNRDIERFMSFIHPLIKIKTLNDHIILFQTYEQFQEHMKQMFQRYDKIRLSIKGRLVLGNVCVDHQVTHVGNQHIESLVTYEVYDRKIKSILIHKDSSIH